jgi:hypothetical protein
MKTRIEQAFNEDGKINSNITYYTYLSFKLLIFYYLGIPMDPQLTNEYYNNFNDFEKDESPERKPPITTTASYNKSIKRQFLLNNQ